jgi:hypothetical protein
LRPLALTVLLLALLVATTAAFALTEALKLERSPITRARFDAVFSPTCACPQAKARLAFRLRRQETLEALIIDTDGNPVRTLAPGGPRAPGRIVLHWDGRDAEGAVVPDGRYRLRVHLAREDRTIVIPHVVRVDTQPPSVELVSLGPRTISPDGDGRADSARIEFRSTERVRPVVVVDGAITYSGRPSGPGPATLFWAGIADDRPVSVGPHVLVLEGRDRAGNRSEPTEAIHVLVRYVQLTDATLRVTRGATLHFHVLADAPRFRWKIVRARREGQPLLSGRAATGRAAIHLPGRIRPGRYVLRVVVNGHGDEAELFVRARG